MKIKLDESELSAIVKDWAKKVYKTNNINVELEATMLTATSARVSAGIEVMLKDEDFASNSTFNEEGFNSLATNMEEIKKRIANEVDIEPDLSGSFDNAGTPI